ncbi:hypothetical protein FJ364_05755 [Candidatus Dependentiae bacterium]|nr:hypothetical protein [Candidatus Dependentiae bacterium]
MSMIRSRDTKPEIIARKFLFGNGFGYKLYDKTLLGKPDHKSWYISKDV